MSAAGLVQVTIFIAVVAVLTVLVNLYSSSNPAGAGQQAQISLPSSLPALWQAPTAATSPAAIPSATGRLNNSINGAMDRSAANLGDAAAPR
jgi:hypothetical protein